MLVAAIGLARHASAIERVRFRSFSTELGLAQSTVSDLAVDSFGFLWLATQDGLSRFDGRRFDNFQKHEDPSRGLKDNFLLALASDARGALYIASQSPTLTRFDLFSERFSHFDLASVLQARDDFVVSLRWLDERRLALSTRRSGVLIFDAEERRLLPQPEVLKAAGTRVLLRLNEQCWLAQGSSMLLADTHFRSVRTVLTLANQVPGALIKRRTGGFLLGTNSVGVIALDEQYRRLDEFSLASAAPRQLSDNYVRTLLEDRQGQIWVATAKGLNRISADLSRVEIYLSDQFSKYSLPGNRISALLEDQRGLIWIGTWTGGVARFDPRSEAFALIQSVPNQKQSLPSNQVGHIAFDQAGAMWAGLVDSRGLVRLNADGLVDTLVDQQRFPNLLSAEVSAIYKRREGGVWFGTLRAGVYAFDEHRQVLSELDHAGAEKLEQASVLSLLEEAQGALWIGTLNEGLWYRCASCTQWRNFRFDPGNPRSLGGDSVAAMAMNHGKLYLGLRRAGLNILTLDAIEQGFQRIEANPNDSSALAHPSISSLSFAADGGLWLATPLGLHRMDTATGLFTRFGKTQGLLSESVSCIIQGADGKAWFSSNGSIASIDQAGNQLAVFSALDGVTGFDFFSGSCARGPDGTLYFGGLHGITSVHPSRLPTPSAPPQVLIKRIEVGGRRMEPQTTAKPLLLAHHQNQLTLELAVDDFREPSAVSFRYRLADQQDFSELPAGQSSILLAGLAAGSYPVELQARFLGQQSFGPVSRVLVEVALPPWRRGWALALYGLLTAMLLVALVWPVRQRLRERLMAAEAIKTSEEQLKIALWGSGSEMWKFDLATRLIERESYLDLPDVPLKQVLPLDEMLALMPVEDRKSFLRAFDSLVHGEADSTEVHYRVRGGSGSWHWLQSRGRVLKRDARGKAVSINGITFDVTKIKDSEAALRMLNAELSQRIAEVEQARAELAASESRRSMALWGTGCEYFEVDLTRQLIMRENALPYLAASGEETDVQSYYGYLHPDDRGRFVQAFVDHVKGLSDHYAVVYRAASTQGDWIWIQTRGRILERAADGWVLKIAGTNYDITELKQREMEARSANEMLEARVAERTQALTQANGKLSETLEELRQMQSELVQREKMAALGGLVAGVAHEIRTPLGIGVTAASHMQDLSAKFTRSMSSGTLTRSETEGFLEDLQQASSLVLSNLRRASDLISSFKQVAVDQSSEQRRVINLKRYMDEILTSLRPAFKHKQFKLKLSCPDQLEFDTYPGAIYQVMVNLVMNSIHHGLLEREQGAIDIDISVHADWVRWQHKDDGVGMNAETCKRIFEPFFTTRRGKGGSGLGMHIVFNLVTQVLKGHIEARSEIGCGTTITIQFPITAHDRSNS